jgi:putative transposase
MPNFRRYFIPNSIVFITAVTRNRVNYLQAAESVAVYWETLERVREIYPFHLLAYVILPDHFHWLMSVEEESGNFSRVIHSLKRNFTRNYKKAHHIDTEFHIWQDRYWDHIIRDEHDLSLHFDYIHWNPVKHKFVAHPEDWQNSSYQHWYKCKYYPNQWGWKEEPKSIAGMNLE